MVRAQLHLTEKIRDGLRHLSRMTGRPRAELIREAIEQYLDRTSVERRKAALLGIFGLWKDRTDLPDFDKLRAEWDRRL